MKVSNHPPSKIKAKLSSLMPLSCIKQLSISSGFLVRAARKIKALDFVLALFMCCAARKATLSNWASQLCILNERADKGDVPSRQAIYKRLTEASSTFAEALLTKLLSSRINKEMDKAVRGRKGVLGFFSSVLVQDSTTISLADTLSNVFKGSVSRGLTKAVARIQCIVDIKTMKFLHFNLGSFCDNDQGAASMIHHLVTKGTLVLRDLGYFVLGSMKQISSQGGYFLSRLKYGPTIYSADKHRKQSLSSLLKSTVTARSVNILLGLDHSLPMRLLIIPLSSKVAAERRRKARKDRDKRLNHSKEYMLALGYQLLVTNVEEDVWTPEQAAEVYRLRWGIEQIFKGFKSAGPHINELFDRVRSNREHARSGLFLALCFMVVQIMIIYRFITQAVKNANAQKTRAGKAASKGLPYLSMNKMITWVCDNFLIWMTSPPDLQTKYVQLFCCYEERKDRINLAQQLQFAIT